MESTNWTARPIPLDAALAERLGLEFEAGILEETLSAVEWGTGAAVAYPGAPPGEAGPSRPEPDTSTAADGAAADGDVALLRDLADIYGRLGQLKKGLEVDQTLVRLFPKDPTCHFQLARRHSRMGHIELALEALRTAIDLGYCEVERLSTDSDLENLKSDERFFQILRRLER